MVYLFGSNQKDVASLLIPVQANHLVLYSDAVSRDIHRLPPVICQKFIGKMNNLSFWDSFMIKGRSTIKMLASVSKRKRMSFFSGDLPSKESFRGLSLKKFLESRNSTVKTSLSSSSTPVISSHITVPLFHPSPLISSPSWLATDIINVRDDRSKECLSHPFRRWHLINIYLSLERFDRYNPNVINIISTSFHLERATFLCSKSPRLYHAKLIFLCGILLGYKKYGYVCVLISRNHFLTPDEVINLPVKTAFSFCQWHP